MKKSLLVVSALFLLSSCGATTSNGVGPSLFNSWDDRDPISRVDNSVADLKSGSACVSNILHIFTVGDSSIESAKKDGGVKNVAYVDRTFSSIFPIYQKGCTVVRGN